MRVAVCLVMLSMNAATAAAIDDFTIPSAYEAYFDQATARLVIAEACARSSSDPKIFKQALDDVAKVLELSGSSEPDRLANVVAQKVEEAAVVEQTGSAPIPSWLCSTLNESSPLMRGPAVAPVASTSVQQQVDKCWNAPTDEPAIADIQFLLDANGELRGLPTPVSLDVRSKAWEKLSAAGVRAIRRCSPYNAPAGEYRVRFETK